MSYILLTAQQADHVRGPTSRGSALMPIPIIPVLGAAFVLSDAVLNDPAHAMHKAYLSACPRTDVVSWLLQEVL
jgi:hypothetical protein